MNSLRDSTMILKRKNSHRSDNVLEQALKDIRTEDMTAICLKIPISLHREFKLTSVQNKIPMNQMFIEAIKEYIKREK